METKIREMYVKICNVMLTLTLMMVTQSVNHNMYCTHGILFILAISEGIV